MIDRKSLENRIRGWFPQEPKIKNKAFANRVNLPKRQVLPPYRFKTFQSLTLLLSLIVLPLNMLICLDSLLLDGVPFAYLAGLIVFGAVIGAILQIVPAYRELQTLSKTGSSSIKLSETITAAFLVGGLCLFIGTAIVRFPPTTLTYSIGIYFLSVALSITVAKELLFGVWERKNKIDLWRQGTVLYTVPKMSAGQKLSTDDYRLKS